MTSVSWVLALVLPAVAWSAPSLPGPVDLRGESAEVRLDESGAELPPSWRTDLESALREADDRERPVLVAVVVGDPAEPPRALAGRLLAASAWIADREVAARLEERFVTVVVNAAAQSLPTELADLVSSDLAARGAPRFLTTAVVYPDGASVLGTSGCSHRCPFAPGIHDQPSRFLSYLDECTARFERLHAIAAESGLPDTARTAQLERLQQEVDLAVQMVTPCAYGDDDETSGGRRYRESR